MPLVAMAVLVLREGGAAAGQAGAALVEAVRNAYGRVGVCRVGRNVDRRTVGQPARQGDRGEGQCSCCECVSELPWGPGRYGMAVIRAVRDDGA